jgi:hypothetical protein
MFDLEWYYKVIQSNKYSCWTTSNDSANPLHAHVNTIDPTTQHCGVVSSMIPSKWSQKHSENWNLLYIPGRYTRNLLYTYHRYYIRPRHICLAFLCRNAMGCIGFWGCRCEYNSWDCSLSQAYPFLGSIFHTRADWPEELGFVWHASKDPAHGLRSSWQQDERISISSSSPSLPHY